MIDQYRAILQRNPSSEELDYWVGLMRSGRAGKMAVRNSLLKSTERYDLLTSLGVDISGSRQSFVSSLYTNVLHTTPQTGAEYTQWVRKANSPINRQLVAQQFLVSAETIQIGSQTLPPVILGANPFATENRSV